MRAAERRRGGGTVVDSTLPKDYCSCWCQFIPFWTLVGGVEHGWGGIFRVELQKGIAWKLGA